jgi:glycosyltransferase involved in cell wall biosynthesis
VDVTSPVKFLRRRRKPWAPISDPSRTDPVHIALVTDAWAPQVNGVVRTLNATVDAIRARGHVVTVVSPDMFPSLSVGALLPGMRFAIPRGIGPYLNAANVVHIATEGPLGHAAKLFCDVRRIPYTTAYHTNYPEYLKTNFRVPVPIAYRYMRWFHRRSRSVLVPTMSMIGDLVGNGFRRCKLWGRGVDTNLFHPHRISNDDIIVSRLLEGLPRPYWINVGRVSKEKGLDDFLKLDLPGTKIVVGEGPDMERLKRAYPDTKFVGKQVGHKLAAFYRHSDVFVFPSRFDTFGLVNIEAISCGTPVAAFPVTGPIDIVEEGVTGSLNEDLKAACLAALKLGRVHKDFSWDGPTDQFLDALIWRSPEEAHTLRYADKPYDFLPPFG